MAVERGHQHDQALVRKHLGEALDATDLFLSVGFGKPEGIAEQLANGVAVDQHQLRQTGLQHAPAGPNRAIRPPNGQRAARSAASWKAHTRDR